MIKERKRDLENSALLMRTEGGTTGYALDSAEGGGLLAAPISTHSVACHLVNVFGPKTQP
jgi:hypothetical protein